MTKKKMIALDLDGTLLRSDNTISDYRSSNKQTLEKIMASIINYSDNNSITIKNLLGLCNLTIQDVSDMQNVIEYKKQNSVNISIDDFYKGLTQNTINYCKIDFKNML